MIRNAIRVLFATLLLWAAPALAADPITGRWITEDGDAIVTIQKCGSSYCGKISRFIVAPPQGANQRDTNNPDPAKRTRRLMGMPVLFSFTENGDHWRGRIYDPKSGKAYRSVVRRTSSTRLEVKGCVGPFCQTQVWRRAQ